MEKSGLAELVRAAADGDDEAWKGLVDRFAGLVWSIARSQGLSATDAADVSQSTWLRLAEHVGAIRDPARIAGWLATTARNESVRLLRRGHRDVLVGSGPELAAGNEGPDIASRLLDDERDRSLMKAFEALPARCRKLLRILTATPPLSYAEASEILEMPIGSIGPTRARCLKSLRRCTAVFGGREDQATAERRASR